MDEDIVERLRQDFGRWHNPETALDVAVGLMKEAADKIERLRLELKHSIARDKLLADIFNGK